MSEDCKTGRVGSNDQRKEAWTTPALVRIAASEAEISTRRGGDGPFTFS